VKASDQAFFLPLRLERLEPNREVIDCENFCITLKPLNDVSRLLSGEVAVVYGRGYRRHSYDKIVHAFDGRQLQIKWPTAALWQ
jgi:hypothetical protein